MSEIDKLKDGVIRSAYNLATKVVRKCHEGRMISVETYGDCQAILRQIDSLNDEMIARQEEQYDRAHDTKP